MRGTFIRALVLMLAGLYIMVQQGAGLEKQDSEDKIIFLHFEKAGDDIRLIDYSIVPGRFKQATTAESNDFEYTITDSDNRILFNGSMDDPLIIRAEYEDTTNPGNWEVFRIIKDRADFFVRLRYEPELKYINFYKRLEKRDAEGKEERISREEMQFLKSIKLPEAWR